MKMPDLRESFLDELAAYRCARELRLKSDHDSATWSMAFWASVKLQDDVLPRALGCLGGLMGEW